MSNSENLLGSLDFPREGQIVGGLCYVQGWVLSDTPDEVELELYIDDSPADAAINRVQRPDLHAVYPELARTNPSPGFVAVVDTSGYSEGQHTFASVARCAGERIAIKQVSVEIRRTGEVRSYERLARQLYKQYEQRVSPAPSLRHDWQPGDLLYFLHVPKTAGTSVRFILESHFRPEEICRFSIDRISEFEAQVEETPPEVLSKYRLFVGHHDYELYKHLPGRRLVYMTMLRDPIDRVISHYAMQIRLWEEHPPHRDRANMTLREFVTSSVGRKHVANLATLQIAGDWRDPRGLPDDELIALAKHNLENFAFVGLVERFEASMQLLGYTFGWSPITTYAAHNVGPDHLTRDQISSETLDAILEQTDLDVQLYRYGRELFEARYAQMADELLIRDSVSAWPEHTPVEHIRLPAPSPEQVNLEGEQLEQVINGFPQWHYQFNLKGILTPIRDEENVNRHEMRKRYIFDPLVELCGGSLEGKRVLDLGCNAGFWSLLAIENGCDFALGIDGRQFHIDQANLVFQCNEVERDRYRFIYGNLFDLDLREFGNFDIVLCLGLMYHVNKPMSLIERMAQVNRDILIIDTVLMRSPDPFLRMRHEVVDDPRNSVDSELVMLPTKQAILEMVRATGYVARVLPPRFEDYTGASDYEQGIRRAFICAKKTDLSRLASEFESGPQESASSEQDTIFGALDHPINNQKVAGIFEVRGWVLSRTSAEILLQLRIDDQLIDTHFGRSPRSDVTANYPDLAASNPTPGFLTRVGTRRFSPGKHTLTCVAWHGTDACVVERVEIEILR